MSSFEIFRYHKFGMEKCVVIVKSVLIFYVGGATLDYCKARLNQAIFLKKIEA